MAIMTLGENKNEDAIPLLVRHLEFREPLTDGEKQGVFLHPQNNSRKYPAIRALAEFGTAAAPSMLSAIISP